MTRSRKLALGLVVIALAAMPHLVKAIDVWDLSGADGSFGTDNELANGSSQVHDLQANAGVADQDWYLIGQAPYASYEVIVDGLTEEVASIPATVNGDQIRLDRVDNGGGLIQSAIGVSGVGAARSLRFRNTTAAEIIDQYIRVQSAVDGCTTACTTNAEYRIQVRETTLMAPRFNNTASQVTVLLLQNGGPTAATATVRFWSAGGVLLGSSTQSLPVRGSITLATSGVVPSQSGSITVDHTGRYGEVTGKAVAVEPSTGFTFDTPLVQKLY